MKDKSFPYETTVDYEQMYNLIAEGYTLIAIIVADDWQHICEVRKPRFYDEITFSTLGMTYLSIEADFTIFVKLCSEDKIKFIKPIF